VVNMDFMFSDSYSGITTINITNLDTSNVVNMEGMFNNCYNLTTINGIIDLKHCATYDRMFTNCSNLTGVKVKNLPTDFNTFCNIARIDKSKVTIVS